MIKNNLNIDSNKVVVVSDNGTASQENIYLLVSVNNGYILSKSVKASWGKVREWALEESGYKYNGSNFKSKSRIYERTVKDKNGNSKTIKEKEVIYFSQKQYNREKHQNERFIGVIRSIKYR